MMKKMLGSVTIGMLSLMLVACGGEGGGFENPGGQSHDATMTVTNHQITFRGQLNEWAITRVTIGGSAFSTYIEPGDSRGFSVPAGQDYTVNVTYSDGTSERRQEPSDPVFVGDGGATVTMWY